MDKDNGKGIDCGRQGWAGWRRAKKGKNWDNSNGINNNFILKEPLRELASENV